MSPAGALPSRKSRFADYNGGIERMIMATVEVNGRDLLQAVQQLPPEDLDAFLEQALSLRTRPRADTLSAKESRLIQRINRGIPEEVCKRFEQLVRKRKRRALTPDEHTELLRLTHEIESQDADRAAALFELSKLRRIPMRMLMKQMGITPAPIHG
jgi:hypothetical protein